MSEETQKTDLSNLGGDLGIPTPEIVTLPIESSGELEVGKGSTDTGIAAPEVKTKVEETPAEKAQETLNNGEDIPFDNIESIIAGIKPKIPTEVKKEEKKTTVETKKEEQQKAISSTKGAVETGKRDYSKFTPEEAKILSQTSNPAFAYINTKIAELGKKNEEVTKLQREVGELKAGKTQIPETLYEHPQAFVILPEWNEATKELDILQQAQNHWQESLGKVRKGEDIHSLKINAQTGQLELGPILKADGNTEAKLLSWIPGTQNKIAQAQQKVLEIQNGFQKKHQEASSILEQATTKFLGFVDDPKQNLIPIRDEIMKQIPAQFHKHPSTKLAVYALTALLHTNNLLKNGASARAKADEAKKLQDAATKNSGPSEGEIATGNGGGSKAPNNSLEAAESFDDVLNNLP